MHVLLTLAAVLIFIVATHPLLQVYYPGKKDWVDVLAAFGPLLVGVCTLWVAYRQMQIDLKMHKQGNRGLYLDIYNLLETALTTTYTEWNVSKESMDQYWEAAKKADTLLAEEVTAFVVELKSRAVEVYSISMRLKRLEDYRQVFEYESRIYQENLKLDVALQELLESAKNFNLIFKRYLKDI